MYMKKFKDKIFKGTVLIAILSILFTFSNMFFTFASDEIAPKIKSVVVLKGAYQDGQTINFNVKFSEDVLLTRTADAGVIYI